MNARPDRWRLSVVAPVYNERENIAPFVAELRAALEKIAPPGGHEIILVNDGSRDDSAEALDAAAAAHPGELRVVHLARNFGLEPALSAGMDRATGDAVVLMDADMQDDPAAIAEFTGRWRAGADVVYAVRASRKEGALRRALFWGFYRVLGALADVELPHDASNFALMDRRVVAALRAMPERNRYLRGLRAWAGFRQEGLPVARRARYDRRTRLGLRGQWKLAMNAIFAFSYVPLFVFRLAGLAALGLAAVLIAWVLYSKLVVGVEIQAWASQMVTISFLGGINLLGIGVVGEYVARIHDEVKARPIYIVHRETPPDP
jgi:dolichol-phosphate mannosyltransferase